MRPRSCFGSRRSSLGRNLASGSLMAAKVASSAKELMIADFNSGTKPNNIGGDFGCWIKDPADPTQGCIEAFDRAARYGSVGYALRLIYSVDSENSGFRWPLDAIAASRCDEI